MTSIKGQIIRLVYGVIGILLIATGIMKSALFFQSTNLEIYEVAMSFFTVLIMFIFGIFFLSMGVLMLLD